MTAWKCIAYEGGGLCVKPDVQSKIAGYLAIIAASHLAANKNVCETVEQAAPGLAGEPPAGPASAAEADPGPPAGQATA